MCEWVFGREQLKMREESVKYKSHLESTEKEQCIR